METVIIPEAQGSSLEAVVTQSTHLAAFLYICGCKPAGRPIKGPERTPNGQRLITKWPFVNDANAEEIVLRWSRPDKATRDWSQLNTEERAIVVNFLTAFSDELYKFMQEAKKLQ
jgi:hypothetical protein